MHLPIRMSLAPIKGLIPFLPGLHVFNAPQEISAIGVHSEQLSREHMNIVLQRRSLAPSVHQKLQDLRLSPFRRQVCQDQQMHWLECIYVLGSITTMILTSAQVSFDMYEEGHQLIKLLDCMEFEGLEQWLLRDMQELALQFCSLLGWHTTSNQTADVP